MAETRVGIVDYGVGNLRSVAAAVAHLGGTPVVTPDAAVLLSCERMIVPGVGAFPFAMQTLARLGLDQTIHDFVATGRPCLGICLGMQLLFQRSTEFALTPGLGFVEGQVVQLTALAPTGDVRLPNVGWLPLMARTPPPAGLGARMLGGVGPDDSFYFIHSYGAAPDLPDTAAISQVGDIAFTSVVARDNLVGTQFHPEKSGPAGLRMLAQFIA